MNVRKMAGRRFQLLAMLDGSHDQAWSSEDLAKVCGISKATVHHILARLQKFGLVDGNRDPESVVGFNRTLKSGAVMSGRMPNKTYFWTITPKGKSRVAYVGGHQKWCPMCSRKG